MQVLQFLCPQDPPATQLKQLMIDQVNIWSRLQRLSTDPEYTTAAFDASMWHEHTTKPGLWWIDYDSVYAQIGDDGRKIADRMLGAGALQGILRHSPLVQALPGTKLELVDVADIVADGYVHQPESIAT
jgi:hypothetical protein